MMNGCLACKFKLVYFRKLQNTNKTVRFIKPAEQSQVLRLQKTLNMRSILIISFSPLGFFADVSKVTKIDDNRMKSTLNVLLIFV